MGTRVDGWTRYIAMCPDGSEGATYAMLTTLSNMAGTGALPISPLLPPSPACSRRLSPSLTCSLPVCRGAGVARLAPFPASRDRAA